MVQQTLLAPVEIQDRLIRGLISRQQAINLLAQYYRSKGFSNPESMAEEVVLQSERPGGPGIAPTPEEAAARIGQPLTSPPPPPPIPEGFTEGLPTRAEAFGAQEEQGPPLSGPLRDVFKNFLVSDPRFASIAGPARGSLERFAPLAELSFLLGQGRAKPTDFPQTFREFLGRGSPFEMPSSILRGLSEAVQGPEGFLREELLDPESGNLAAFRSFLAPSLRQITPAFRSAASQIAERGFRRFAGTTPELPFAQELARRGGFFR